VKPRSPRSVAAGELTAGPGGRRLGRGGGRSAGAPEASAGAAAEGADGELAACEGGTELGALPDPCASGAGSPARSLPSTLEDTGIVISPQDGRAPPLLRSHAECKPETAHVQTASLPCGFEFASRALRLGTFGEPPSGVNGGSAYPLARAGRWKLGDLRGGLGSARGGSGARGPVVDGSTRSDRARGPVVDGSTRSDRARGPVVDGSTRPGRERRLVRGRTSSLGLVRPVCTVGVIHACPFWRLQGPWQGLCKCSVEPSLTGTP
jgi:hypothetical protein